MSYATRLIVGGIVLFPVMWMLIFGGTGALLYRARGGSPHLGLLLGLLGPLGWAWIWQRTRGGAISAPGAIALDRFDLDPWNDSDTGSMP